MVFMYELDNITLQQKFKNTMYQVYSYAVEHVALSDPVLEGVGYIRGHYSN